MCDRSFAAAAKGEKRAILALPFIALARLWQIGPSRLLPATCRFAPSCSAYAITALGRYGAAKGLWLTVTRLVRCHPWGGSGYDPVP